MLKKGGNWQLAPAYDLCHAYRPGSQWVSQHSLSINGKRNGITRNDLLSVAKGISMKKNKANNIINEINDIIQNWHHYAQEVQVSTELKNSIHSTLLDLSE